MERLDPLVGPAEVWGAQRWELPCEGLREVSWSAPVGREVHHSGSNLRLPQPGTLHIHNNDCQSHYCSLSNYVSVNFFIFLP